MTTETDQPGSGHSGHRGIIIGLVIGIGLGLLAHAFGDRGPMKIIVPWLVAWAEPIGRIFLRMMQTVVVPLVFSALSLAVIEIGDLRKLGRIRSGESGGARKETAGRAARSVGQSIRRQSRG
jgi:DAACS family dicarboxylate/amino acid:cation (Na+ or H+) symporter